MKFYIIIAFSLIISTKNTIGLIFADEVYPGDFHTMEDFIPYNATSDINVTNISLSIIDKKIKYSIAKIDGEFEGLIIERFKKKLVIENYELYKTTIKVSELGKNEKLAASPDYQSISYLIELNFFIDSDVEYITDLCDIYMSAKNTDSDIILRKQIAKLIKVKSAQLLNKLISNKSKIKSKIDFKKISSELILPMYINTTERFSALMNESKSIYDSIPVTN